MLRVDVNERIESEIQEVKQKINEVKLLVKGLGNVQLKDTLTMNDDIEAK